MTIVEAYEERGRKKGRKEGHENGRLEATQTLAVKLIQRGDKLQDIAELTGLSMDELKKLANQNH